MVKILDSSVAEYAVEEGATIDQDVDGILLVAADDITVDGAAVSGNRLAGDLGDRLQSRNVPLALPAILFPQFPEKSGHKRTALP